MKHFPHVKETKMSICWYSCNFSEDSTVMPSSSQSESKLASFKVVYLSVPVSRSFIIMAEDRNLEDIFGPNGNQVNQLGNRVGNLENFASEYRNNLAVLRLEQQNQAGVRLIQNLNPQTFLKLA